MVGEESIHVTQNGAGGGSIMHLGQNRRYFAQLLLMLVNMMRDQNGSASCCAAAGRYTGLVPSINSARYLVFKASIP